MRLLIKSVVSSLSSKWLDEVTNVVVRYGWKYGALSTSVADEVLMGG